MPGTQVCVKNCKVSEFFTQFPMLIKSGPPPKGHPANLTQLWEALESIWASIPVECFCPDELRLFLRAKGGLQLNIRKVVLTFGMLGVCCPKRCAKFVESYSKLYTAVMDASINSGV